MDNRVFSGDPAVILGTYRSPSGFDDAAACRRRLDGPGGTGSPRH